MRITPRWMAFLVVSILFGGILVSVALGQWTTKSTKEPLKFSEGEYAGEYNPADIRGSYTFGDVSRLFEIPLEDLAVAFRISEPNVAAVSLKTLEEKFADLDFEVGTGSVKLFVALYKGVPYDLSGEDAFLLPEAVKLIKQNTSLSQEQLDYLENYTVSESAELPTPALYVGTQPSEIALESTPTLAPTGGAGNPGGGSGTPNPKQDPEEQKIAGKTTFQDLMDWGVKQEEIEKAIGQPLPAANLLIKDWATSQGLTFSTLKDQLQALVDALE